MEKYVFVFNNNVEANTDKGEVDYDDDKYKDNYHHYIFT